MVMVMAMATVTAMVMAMDKDITKMMTRVKKEGENQKNLKINFPNH
jgi:hypothetical protein